MTAYTDNMVATLRAQAPFTYESAKAFADEHSLSVRSVISKLHNLGLEYNKQERVAAQPRVRKADIVRSIALALSVSEDAIAGLAKADAKSLEALVRSIG